MATKKDKKNEKEKDNPITKPDPETLNTTDPQEEMEGPVSSIVQDIKDEAEENNDTEKEEKQEKKKK